MTTLMVVTPCPFLVPVSATVASILEGVGTPGQELQRQGAVVPGQKTKYQFTNRIRRAPSPAAQTPTIRWCGTHRRSARSARAKWIGNRTARDRGTDRSGRPGKMKHSGTMMLAQA